ncbi:MAG: TolC family protein [Hyphomicrobiaceae bacterium]
MIARRQRASLLALSIAMAGGTLSGCAVTPVELSSAEMSMAADGSLSTIAAGQEPIAGAIDLYEAMARALKYNLDHQVELAEQAVRERELRLAHYSLLPSVVAGSGYAARNEILASSSRNASTGLESLATSTSQDRRLRDADIAFGWNVLDFGLSYVRARQAADHVLIQNELRRKVALRLLEDVRAAFWRAVSAQRLLSKLHRVEMQAREVEREARRMARDQQTSQITALTYEREIVEIQRTIGEITRELNTAKAELGALMNVPPFAVFSVRGGSPVLPRLPRADPRELVHLAVMNRPELREVEYRLRINEHEAHAALLELLPGVQLIAGANWDSNSFLLYNNWMNWGAKASWNLLKVFSYPARRSLVEEQEALLVTKARAVTMAIMTQVYVSRIRYAHAQKEHGIAVKYRNVQNDLLQQIRKEASAGRVARQTLVREELNTVVAEAKLDIAYATLQSAYANVETSIGIDPIDGLWTADSSIRDIAAMLRSSGSSFLRTASAE